MYIGIIVFRFLKHSDELDMKSKVKPLTLLWGRGHNTFTEGARPSVSLPLVTALLSRYFNIASFV